MRKLIAANWKENPKTEKQAVELFRATAKAAKGARTEVAVYPPLVYLEKIAEVKNRMKGARIGLGSQDIFWEDLGAFTSEVGPKILKSLGAKYAIVGHSERRKYLKETDAIVNKKVKAALAEGMHVILCVGEGLAIRKKGFAAAKKFVHTQLSKNLANIPVSEYRHLSVAYEPIWAIGTGRYDKPEDAAEMAIAVKQFLKKKIGKRRGGIPRFLYGGSVHSANVSDYVKYKEIDGALVGGASLKPKEFKKIINYGRR